MSSFPEIFLQRENHEYHELWRIRMFIFKVVRVMMTNFGQELYIASRQTTHSRMYLCAGNS